ncbi:hypothetical protein [Arthrobacter sp. R4-81]
MQDVLPGDLHGFLNLAGGRSPDRKIHFLDAQGFGYSTFIKPGPSTAPVVFEPRGAVRAVDLLRRAVP